MQPIALEAMLRNAEERGLMMIKDRVMTALLDDDEAKRTAAVECLHCMCLGTIRQGSVRDGRMILEVQAGNTVFIDVGQVPQDYASRQGYPFTIKHS